MITLIRHYQQKTTQWSGGTTTELWLWPQGSSYSERTFDIRMSTATINVSESTFSDLTGYTRHLMSLTDPITLFQDQREPYTLTPLTSYIFDGSASMKSMGTATDFNVMVKPWIHGDLQAHTIAANESLIMDGNTFAIYVLDGNIAWTCDQQSNEMNSQDFLMAQDESPMTLIASRPTTLIVIRIDADTL
jgi:environmental stress-induced protein Ves